MSQETETKLPPKEVRAAGACCHMVHKMDDHFTICGIPREEVGKDCPYEDYLGDYCKCGKQMCPECQNG